MVHQLPLNRFSLLVRDNSSVDQDLWDAYQRSGSQSEMIIHTLANDFEHVEGPNCPCHPFYLQLNKPHITYPDLVSRFRCYATQN